MKIGITGISQSGKTTAFKILLQADIPGTIGVFRIFDRRIEKLVELLSSKKITYPEFIFTDLGPTSGFSKKELAKLQEIDLFVCVIGAFFGGDPRKDFDSALTDIIVSDLELIQNRLDKLKKEQKKRDTEQESKVLEKCQAYVSEGNVLSGLGLTMDEIKLLSGLALLSLKPIVLAINTSDQEGFFPEEKIKSLMEYCASKGLEAIRFFGKTESELLELPAEEREKFMKEMGEGYSFREKMSGLITKKLELLTFFTAGDKETRGWHLRSGLPVIEAAGKIHSDIKRGFIRAEVMNYVDLIGYGSEHKVREAGLLRLEGKDYIVKDGDILNIRFNV
ncbi:MAG: DUF933 domain-containing protein [Candidatus Omnitrophica bacterium]|nr:DUF933 domain-containing protein [Candidatus Omnitrophota bacterium]